MAKQAAPKDEKTEVGFLNEYADQGFEGLTAEDFTIPFLRIAQPLSPQIDEDNDAYIQGCKPGMFFNTVTGRLYGTTVQVIPVMYKKLWLEWAPNRGGLVGRHEPKSIPVDKSNFGSWKNEKGNTINEHHVFYCLVANHLDEGPVAFSLTSTGIKHARNWNTQIMMTKLPSGQRAPYFSSVWELTTVKNSNAQGNWWQIGGRTTAVERKRFITNEEFTQFVLPNRESLESLKELDFAQLEDNSERNVTPEGADGNNVPY